MSTTISAPQGFYQNDTVTPATIGDLTSAVAAALTNLSQAVTSATAAAASATAANTSSVSAAASNTAAGNSATDAAASASAAAGSVTTSAANSTSAASSATAAATSATTASTGATSATASATAAATSATNASNSASAAATSATNAAASATTASNASATIPAPSVARELAMVRVNSTGTAYETRTPAQVLSDIGGAAATDLSATNASRNKLHNGMFTVQQRGVGPFTTNVYAMDRWVISFINGTTSVTPASLADADRTAIADEEALTALQNVFTGTAAAGDLNVILQKIENARRLGNKTVTVSFWAKAAAGTPNLGVSLDQFFGTGGSPSATVPGTGQAIALSTTWTRYTVTFVLASLAGKTLGTNGDHSTNLIFWFSAGSTNATRSGSVGVQSGTFQIWGVQLEVGSAATSLEKRDPQHELALCQRFCRTGAMQIAGYNLASNASVQQYDIPAMRASPTVVANFSTNSNCSASALVATTRSTFQVSTTVTATGVFNAAGTYTASADL